MTGRQKIYVDFTVRDPEGRYYAAQRSAFSPLPQLGLVFVATDFDEFEVECEVVAIQYDMDRVFLRPVDAEAVPGSAPHLDGAGSVSDAPLGVRAERASEELVFSHSSGS